MPEVSLHARPPLAGLAEPGRVGAAGPAGASLAEIVDMAGASLIARRGERAAAEAILARLIGAPAPATGRFAAGEDFTAIGVGPGQWVLFAPGRVGAIEQRLRPAFGASAAIADQGDAFAMVEIAGPMAGAALRKGLTIDLDARAFPPGSAARTLAAQLSVLLWRLGADRWRIAAPRSYAGSFWHWLTESVAAYGCDVLARRGF